MAIEVQGKENGSSWKYQNYACCRELTQSGIYNMI